MSDKKTRTLRVYTAAGCSNTDTPTIILKGKWLKEYGLDIGQFFDVQCEEGKLTIVKRDPPEAKSDKSEKVLSKLSKEEQKILAKHYKSLYS